MSSNLADELRKRRAELQTPPSDVERDPKPPAPPKPKKTRKPKAEFSDYVKEIADASGIPATVLLSPNPNMNLNAICTPSELDRQIRIKNHVPISATQSSLAIYHIPDLDEKAFVLRYSRSKRDFDIYYSLLMRGSGQ